MIEQQRQPASVIDTSEFVAWCRRDRPRTYDYIRRWDILYRHCQAEYCKRRRDAFASYYGKPLSVASSIDLCLAERYTACVNFVESADGVTRHVCDILPIIIGSELDRSIREAFWRADRSVWCEDELKIGLLIQNKNFYHFTTTMATNPKVAHIYRRSNKLHRLDSRVYYYDNNFRGNMFYFEQSLLLTKCLQCALAGAAEDMPSSANQPPCQGPMCIIVEELFLRNCFKQDHLLMRRFCCVFPDVVSSLTAGSSPAAMDESGRAVHTHDAAVPIILRYFQQRDKQGGSRFFGKPDEITSASSLTRLLKSFGQCDAFFARFSGGTKINNILFEEDLACYGKIDEKYINQQQEPTAAMARSSLIHRDFFTQGGIHIRLTNERDLASLLLCDCEASELNRDFVSFVMNDRLAESCPNEQAQSAVRTFWRIDNMDEFRRISDSCFPKWTRERDDLQACGDNAGYYDQLFVLYTYMREVMLRNEDIDQLCNKCVFDGSYLYYKLMQQMREYLCHRFCLQQLDSDWVETLVARYRALAHTANLYMLISSKTHIRVDMANDLKRSLKLSIKREKMQQTDCSVTMNYIDMRDTGAANLSGISNYTGAASLNLSSPGPSSALSVTFPVEQTVCYPPVSCTAAKAALEPAVPAKKRRKLSPGREGDCVAGQQTISTMDLDTNDKCDFVIKGGRSSKFRHLYTGNYPQRLSPTIAVASCNTGDINARQLITYDSQHLLQNVASSHFTDIEFVLEQVKRPRVTNQQNSSKCALMPRQSTRFLSAYNIGNMSVAGRTINICSRNSVTFFVTPANTLCEKYYQWLRVVYRRLTEQEIPSVCHTHRQRKCTQCFFRLMINEVPCAHFLIDKYYEFSLFVLTKYWWPAVQFYRKTGHIISVTLISGVILVPVSMVFDDMPVVRIDDRDLHSLRYDNWLFCQRCHLYFARFALDRSSNLFFIDDRRSRELHSFRHHYLHEHRAFLVDDGGVRQCNEHTWFSSNDMQYYTSMLAAQTFSGRNERHDFYVKSLNAPFFYEVACHGLFLNSKFVDATDISKLTVSVNASKRRLRLRSSMCRDRLETLMDQNTRMYVDDRGATSSFPGFQEPLQDIVGVPGQNAFRCCFMFGDFKGRNCEDAYVFDQQSRPRLVNTIQLKVNYYRQDHGLIDTSAIRFHFAPVVNRHTGSGCTFFFGHLVSPCRLSFGSTFVQVKTIKSSPGFWIYQFYYTNWSSYLRESEMVFSADKDKPAGGDSHEGLPLHSEGEVNGSGDDGAHRRGPRVTFDRRLAFDLTRNQPLEKRNGGSTPVLSGNNRIICAHSYLTANGRIHIEMQMTSRQLRFTVTLRHICAIQKLQNHCGQKGVTSYEDLSDLITSRGGRVHVIVSLYSVNGRQLLAQLLEQYSNAGTAYSYRDSLPLMSVHSKRRGGEQVGFAGYGEFFFSCDSPHDNIIVSSQNFGNNAMRMCNMTYFAAIGNNLSTSIANRSADYVNHRNNPINGMSLNVNHCLSVYHYYSRQLYLRDLLTRETRQRLRDWVEMNRRGIGARLPLSLHFPGNVSSA